MKGPLRQSSKQFDEPKWDDLYGFEPIEAVVNAMDGSEDDYETLKGVQPKTEYQELDNDLLANLLRTFNDPALKKETGDFFGRIYECFLSQFANQSAHFIEKMHKNPQGSYRYYGAQSVIDYIDGYLSDREYVLVAADGANLVTRNEPISQVVSGQFGVNNQVYIVQAKQRISTNKFIYFLANINNISRYMTGAAQPKLSQKNLRIIEFEAPDY